MRNFVRDSLALHACMIREELSGNEFILLTALFMLYNDRHFPGGPISVGINQLLAYTNFTGSTRDDTLRITRKRLEERGLIRVTPGVAHVSKASYEIIWSAVYGDDDQEAEAPAEDDAQDAPQDSPKDAPKDAPKKPEVFRAESRGSFVNVNPKTDSHTRDSAVCQAARAREADGAEKAELSTGLSTGALRKTQRNDTGAAKTQRNELPVCEEVIAVDSAWKYSPRARCAVAQRLLNAGDRLLDRTTVVTDAGDILDGRELFDTLVGAMAAGVSPGRCLALLGRCREGWEWEALLMDEVRRTGCTPPEWLERLRNLESCFPDWKPKEVRAPWR